MENGINRIGSRTKVSQPFDYYPSAVLAELRHRRDECYSDNIATNTDTHMLVFITFFPVGDQQAKVFALFMYLSFFDD